MSFVVYKSSAGSGKTYTLVKEYLKLTLATSKDDDYKHILAITFTNKAANEMKERVLKALIQLSSNENVELLNTLSGELKLDSKVVVGRSSNVLKHILHHYADFSISTIDKFVHKVIRIFAFDLKLPLNFEVELDAKELLSNAIDELINKVGKDEQLTTTLLKYTEEKADAERSWHIEKDIESFAGNLLKEEYQGYIQSLRNISLPEFFELRKKINQTITDKETIFKQTGVTALEIIHNANINDGAFAYSNSGIKKYFEYWAELRTDKFTPNSYVQKIIDEDKWYSSKANATEKQLIEGIKLELIEVYNITQKLIVEHYNEYIELKLLYDNLYGLAVLNEIEKVVEEIKKENNIIHISEFNKKISAIVLNEPAPFIYERIGERFSNYLIDEFQDTSELQWQNLLPLVDNALATNNFNMVVGDGKQAIYRWRGGEVEQFSMLPHLPAKFASNHVVKERENSLIRNFEPKKLDKNYRSKVNIVEFNNNFFRLISEQLEPRYQKIYEDVFQHSLEHKKGGYISFEVVEYADKDYYKNSNFEKVLKHINQAIEDNYQLKDIAILTRNNKEAILIADYLMQNDIKVVSNESLLVSSSSKVRAIIASLVYLQDTNNIEAKLQLIKHICSVKSIEFNHELLEYLIKNDNFLYFINENEISFHSENVFQKPLLELLNSIAEQLIINPKADSFVSRLFEFAFKQIQKKAVDAYTFLEEWEKQKNKLSITLSEGIDAVSIMTIHKSKGLQFPVVIFPFASWDITIRDKKHWVNVSDNEINNLKVGLINHKKELQQTKHSLLYDEEQSKVLLDNINLLYVAFTRPEDRLHVIMSDSNKTISKHTIPILEKFEQWNTNEKSLQIGELSKSKMKENQVLNTVSLSSALPKKKKLEKLAVSFQNTEYWNQLEGVKGRNFGVLVHQLLAEKSFNKLDEISKNIEQYTTLSTSLKKELRDYIETLLLNKNVENLLKNNPNDRLFVEREILLENGEVLRPDRVVINENNVKIIDFKTGSKQEKYQKQLNLYANALTKIGYQNIESYILYTDTGEIEKV